MLTLEAFFTAVLAGLHRGVVIFGGLVSSTVLDTLLTPLLYWLLGEAPTRRLLGESAHTTDLAPDAEEAF